MLRLEERPFEIEGTTYRLRCNMAVLEEVEDAHGGDFNEVMNLPPRSAALEFLAAMLNEEERLRAAEKRWTAEELRHKLSLGMLREVDVLSLVSRALSVSGEGKAEPGGDSGN